MEFIESYYLIKSYDNEFSESSNIFSFEEDEFYNSYNTLLEFYEVYKVWFPNLVSLLSSSS